MKILAFLVVILLFAGGFFSYIQFNYSNIPLGSLISSDSRMIADLSSKFMECLQFKDFKAASEYSIPEHRKTYNIPQLIERLFQIKPEFLDINKIQIISTELDSTGKRAKVNIQTDVKILNTNELRKPNIILYWKKLPDDNWYMDLATSLQ